MPEMIFIDPKDSDQFQAVYSAVLGEMLAANEKPTVLDVVAATMRQSKAYEMRRVCDMAGIYACQGDCKACGRSREATPCKGQEFKQAIAAVKSEKP